MIVGYCDIEPYTAKEVFDFCEATKYWGTIPNGQDAFMTDSLTVIREGRVFSTGGIFDSTRGSWGFVNNDEWMEVTPDGVYCGEWD